MNQFHARRRRHRVRRRGLAGLRQFLAERGLDAMQRARQPVGDIIGDVFGDTMLLSLSGLVLSWGLALPIAIYCAMRPRSAGDYVVSVLVTMGLAIPTFLLALASLAVQAQTLRIGLAEDVDVLDPTLSRGFVGRIVFSAMCDGTAGR